MRCSRSFESCWHVYTSSDHGQHMLVVVRVNRASPCVGSVVELSRLKTCPDFIDSRSGGTGMNY